MPKFKDLTGQKFNNWTVIRRAIESENVTCKGTKYLCRCACGIEKIVFGCHLVSNKSLSCRRCSEHKHKNKLNSKLWHRILYGAKIRNLAVTITKEYAYDLFYYKQNCKCALTGCDLVIANTIQGHRSKQETTASLDRIDSTEGYIEGNVQWVHKDINKMKQNFSQLEFINLCRMVVKHYDKTKP